MTRVSFARFPCVIIGLMAVSGSEVRVTGSGSWILCLEIPLRFLVMVCGPLIVVRGIVMMARSRMLTGHGRAPDLVQLASCSCG